MNDSLKVIVNDDSSITIDWDETDPKYSFLNDLTEEEFSQLLMNQIQNLINETNGRL